MRKWLAFDIEISKCVPDGETDWTAHRPLGISCWAIACQNSSGKIITTAMHGEDEQGRATPQMSREECVGTVEMLQEYVGEGYTIVGWNSLSFDFDILAEESGMHAECCELAKNHVDLMFQVFCQRGHPLALNTAAKGMGLSGKIDGMDGSQAPVLWQAGEYQKVLEYLAQDVRCTLEVALRAEKLRGVTWIARSGRRNVVPMQRLLTVRECLSLPMPDNSWMQNPLSRSRFTAWMAA